MTRLKELSVGEDVEGSRYTRVERRSWPSTILLVVWTLLLICVRRLNLLLQIIYSKMSLTIYLL